MAKEIEQNNSGNSNVGDEKNKKDEGKNKNNKLDSKKKNLVVVRFKKSYTPYLKGEKAGLNKDEAKRLIEMELCEKV